MWATLLPILLPVVEAAAAGALGYLIAHFGPSLGIDPAQAAILAASLSKLAPTNVTAKLVPVPGEHPPGADKILPTVP